jgi:hypothetical protein
MWNIKDIDRYTNWIKCKICNEEFDELYLLEHAAKVHNDKEAIDLLDKLNQFKESQNN